MAYRIHSADEPTDKDFYRYNDVYGASPGTVALFDPTTTLGGLSGVPTAGASIPNAVRKRSLEIINAAQGLSLTDLTLADLTFNLARESSSTLSVSRTEKGGLALLPSQVAQTSPSGNHAHVDFSTTIRDFIFAKAADGIRIALHIAVIRAPLAVTGGPHNSLSYMFSNTSPTANFLWTSASGAPAAGISAGASGGPGGAGFDPVTLIINSPKVIDVATIGWAGTAPGSAGSTASRLVGVGRGPSLGATTTNKDMGIVIYRAKVEYLPYCKRYNGVGGTPAQEYAAARVADIQQLTIEDFGVGGKFYGDKLTVDPAVFT